MLSHTPTTNRIIAAATIAWLATASNGITASLTPQEQKLVEDAKKEGAVTFSTRFSVIALASAWDKLSSSATI